EPLPDERRAQHGMARQDPLPGAAERRQVELSGQRTAELVDVEAGVRLPQAVEQHPLLERGGRIGVLDRALAHELACALGLIFSKSPASWPGSSCASGKSSRV